MNKLNLTKEALDFWEALDAKQYKQIGRKVLSLLFDPYPHNFKSFVGYPGYFRVNSGEYRIIYKYALLWQTDQRFQWGEGTLIEALSLHVFDACKSPFSKNK